MNIHKFSPDVDRLIYRQHTRCCDALRYYSNRLVLIEQENRVCQETWNAFHDIKNTFYDQFCHISWILLGEQGEAKTHCFRLIDTDDWLTKEVISFSKSIINDIATGTAHKKELFNKALLNLAGITKSDRKKALESLSEYRNKFIAHADDYFPQTPEEIIIYPELLNVAKLIYGLYQINLRVTADKILLQPFDELINNNKKEFEKGLIKLGDLLV